MKGNLNVFLTVKVKDKNGKIVYEKTERARSFTLQFLQFIEVQSYPSLDVSITDITNTPKTVVEAETNLKMEGAVGSVSMGIMVGTGTTPVDNLDYVMETKIAHGVAAGELSYGAMSKVAAAEVGANVDYILQRSFTNSSGGTINVTEFGMQCMSTGAVYFLIIHDVVTAVPVLNTQVLTATYTFRTTV